MHLSRIALSFVLATFIVAITACSKQEKSSSGQQQSPSAAPSSQTAPATPPSHGSATPAQPAASGTSNAEGKPTGPAATEKYVLNLTNYSKVPVTIKVNGQWVGQWDDSANVPLDMVVKGNNELTVEVASEPKNTVTVDVNTTRDGRGVTIMSLNFQGQTGTHTSTFVVR
jgi:VCBS repeat-containing protein